jgi:hypothetical protein
MLPKVSAITKELRTLHTSAARATFFNRVIHRFGVLIRGPSLTAACLIDDLLHRTRQPVELPHDQRVAAAREFQRVAKGWSIRNRARQLLGENPTASRFSQSIPLKATFWSSVETRAISVGTTSMIAIPVAALWAQSQ